MPIGRSVPAPPPGIPSNYGLSQRESFGASPATRNGTSLRDSGVTAVPSKEQQNVSHADSAGMVGLLGREPVSESSDAASPVLQPACGGVEAARFVRREKQNISRQALQMFAAVSNSIPRLWYPASRQSCPAGPYRLWICYFCGIGPRDF